MENYRKEFSLKRLSKRMLSVFATFVLFLMLKIFLREKVFRRTASSEVVERGACSDVASAFISEGRADPASLRDPVPANAKGSE